MFDAKEASDLAQANKHKLDLEAAKLEQWRLKTTERAKQEVEEAVRKAAAEGKNHVEWPQVERDSWGEPTTNGQSLTTSNRLALTEFLEAKGFSVSWEEGETINRKGFSHSFWSPGQPSIKHGEDWMEGKWGCFKIRW